MKVFLCSSSIPEKKIFLFLRQKIKRRYKVYHVNLIWFLPEGKKQGIITYKGKISIFVEYKFQT